MTKIDLNTCKPRLPRDVALVLKAAEAVARLARSCGKPLPEDTALAAALQAHRRASARRKTKK